jgi:hypothetical protein
MLRSYFLLFVIFQLVHPFGIGQEKSNLQNFSYNGVPEKIADLSLKVNETSGVIYFDKAIWTFNDSGGKPELYKIGENGSVVQTVIIDNAKNQDWEDITMDDEYIYVGDFGNNWGTRKDLVIYKVSQKEMRAGNSKVQAELIQISYTDQKSFGKMNRAHNFDGESIISFGESLILFSKNWADNKTKIYKLSKIADKYELSPLDSFFVNGLITGADYNEETGKLALIGYSAAKEKTPFVYIFKDFNGKNFNSTQIYKISIPGLFKSQTEGICWVDHETLVISTEETRAFKPGLYKLKLQELIPENE